MLLSVVVEVAISRLNIRLTPRRPVRTVDHCVSNEHLPLSARASIGSYVKSMVLLGVTGRLAFHLRGCAAKGPFMAPRWAAPISAANSKGGLLQLSPLNLPIPITDSAGAGAVAVVHICT